MIHIEPEPPVIAKGMRKVTHAEFFAKIGPLNVHPRIVSNYDMITGYVSQWRMQDMSERVIGVSDGGTTFLEDRYWLAE
jgi:hypothetical protein